MSSVQESETGAGFLNTQELVPTRTALIEMGHPKGPIPIQFDNKYAVGIINDKVISRTIQREIDMRIYWLRDRQRQGQFHIHWKKGDDNMADCVTIHFAAKHRQLVRPKYVTKNIKKQK
uniref:Uncharacterized protein n=1 Tax=Proboscia inermis TaxID=420281 RepID=A0A6T8ISM5_9STRA|mmetsp:Transcript_26543/g.26929  ORF Transcript_26543/g.26929 Transcript_26543/m.26929 type:complete len:119 (+) Transcript_26543:165-521(+)